MTTNELLTLFKVNDIRTLPESIMAVLLGNQEERDAIYQQLLRMNDYDMSYDWFQQLYEEELSQRKEKKQDFTPQVLGSIASMICGDKQRSVYEPTAGNGSMLILTRANSRHNLPVRKTYRYC